MKGIIYGSLVIALSLLIYTFISQDPHLKKLVQRWGMIFYALFTVLAFANSMLPSKTVNINQTNVSLTPGKNIKLPVQKEEKTLKIYWEPDTEQIQVGSLFNLKLVIENNLDQDIKYLRLSFEDKPLAAMFMVSKVAPEVNISKDYVGIGKVEKGAKKEFNFELVPFTEGSYTSKVVPLDDYAEIDGEVDLASEIMIEIGGNN